MTAQWATILQELKKSFKSGDFKVWIAPLEGRVEGSCVALSAPNHFVASFVRERFSAAITQAAALVLGLSAPEVRLEISHGPAAARAVAPANAVALASPVAPAAPASPVPPLSAPSASPSAPLGSLPLLSATKVLPQSPPQSLPKSPPQSLRGRLSSASFAPSAPSGSSVSSLLPPPAPAGEAQAVTCQSIEVHSFVDALPQRPEAAQASLAGPAAAPRRPLTGMEALALDYPLLHGTNTARNRATASPITWRYRFDDYVVGPTNEVAVAAARDLCRQTSPIETLFLSAESGLGKTHLVQAMGQVLTESKGSCSIAYLTAEEFTSRFVAALRARDMDGFKSSLRDVDVLMLEDVHFFQGKGKIQDEALTTIKSLQARDSRVVLTSSFTPRELHNVDSQLVSHFCSGFLTHIGKPTVDMRRSILTRKASLHQVMLPDSVTELLADRICSDVRQLESCLNNLIFKARHLNRQISLEMALEIVAQYAHVDPSLDVETIIRLVCESYGLNPHQLTSRSRRQECVVARNTIYYLARKHTDLSLQDIGEKFNRRHSTVIKGITNLEREMQRESSLGRQVRSTVTLIERNAGINAA